MNDMTLNLRMAFAAVVGADRIRLHPNGGDGTAEARKRDRVVVAGGAH